MRTLADLLLHLSWLAIPLRAANGRRFQTTQSLMNNRNDLFQIHSSLLILTDGPLLWTRNVAERAEFAREVRFLVNQKVGRVRTAAEMSFESWALSASHQIFQLVSWGLEVIEHSPRITESGVTLQAHEKSPHPIGVLVGLNFYHILHACGTDWKRMETCLAWKSSFIHFVPINVRDLNHTDLGLKLASQTEQHVSENHRRIEARSRNRLHLRLEGQHRNHSWNEHPFWLNIHLQGHQTKHMHQPNFWTKFAFLKMELKFEQDTCQLRSHFWWLPQEIVYFFLHGSNYKRRDVCLSSKVDRIFISSFFL